MMDTMDFNGIFETYAKYESSSRSYCRSVSVEFIQSSGSWLYTSDGVKYLDFMSGCGSVNYGHNHPVLRAALLEYITNDGLTMGLDFHSKAKRDFLVDLNELILAPRGLHYKTQFTGPTGTNAIEAAIKLARKYTGRSNVVSFTNAFHGCSLGALALTGNRFQRSSSAGQLGNVIRAPFCGYADGLNTANYLGKLLRDPSSGIEVPAAFILEIIQGEGGLNVASKVWAQEIARLAVEHDALLIVDEIQTGCGRSGSFFAFEQLGLKPDLVTLAKSLSGYGTPLSIVLISPDIDVWEPAEHNGTFRGNCQAFVTASTAIRHFWADDKFQAEVVEKGEWLSSKLEDLGQLYGCQRRGLGLMQGLRVEPERASRVKTYCADHLLLIENCGPQDEVIKIMPPLTADYGELSLGLEIITKAIAAS